MDRYKEEEIEGKIVCYLSGEMPAAEMNQLLDWMQESDNNKQLFAEHKKIWLASRALESFSTQRIEQAQQKTMLKIDNAELNRRLNQNRRYIRCWQYAAAVLMVVCLSTAAYVYFQRQSFISFAGLSENTIEVPYGGKSQIVLPDGSRVWINAGSKISYSSDFGLLSRNVYLEGEAYFDVKENKKIPFFVNTDLIDIKVYGTAFNVKSYLDDDVSETTLDRGEITITSKNNPDKIVHVVPNQKVVIHRYSSDEQTKKSLNDNGKDALGIDDYLLGVEENVNTKNITAWKDNRLVFEQESLGVIAKRLERRYNVKFSFSNEKMKSIRYTAVLKEMPIDQVMKAMALTSPIKYTINGMQITLSENNDLKYNVSKE